MAVQGHAGSDAVVDPMKIAFRTDASLRIGSGHVMRCLTLADTLRHKGIESHFLCREHAGHLIELIRQKGYAAHVLPNESGGLMDADDPFHGAWLGTSQQQDARACTAVLQELQPSWLIVDHYALDFRWEQRLRPFCQRLMVIDDLADRPHQCDLLLDQNVGRTEAAYSGLVGPATKLLIGPQYALLRPEFAQWREYSLQRRANPQLKHMLITMGGVDKNDATGRVLEALRRCDFPAELSVTVVMGSLSPWLAQVRERAAKMPWPTTVLVGINNMAQLMAESDLAIGAAGSTSWERCCLGLPTIQVILADNQKEVARTLVDLGSAFLLNEKFELTEIIRQLDRETLQHMSAQASAICNGTGATKVVCALQELT